MKNTQTLQCIACGGKLTKLGTGEYYKCRGCGNTFDLHDFHSIEIDLDVFDRLLLYNLKKARVSNKRTTH